jgi:hypothetical protein
MRLKTRLQACEVVIESRRQGILPQGRRALQVQVQVQSDAPDGWLVGWMDVYGTGQRLFFRKEGLMRPLPALLVRPRYDYRRCQVQPRG